MKIKGKNVLESFLTLLGVRYTKSFTEKYFNEHPYKFSLYGISKILFDYGIDNLQRGIISQHTEGALFKWIFRLL